MLSYHMVSHAITVVFNGDPLSDLPSPMISKATGDPDAMFNVATQYLQGAAGEVDVQKALTPGSVERLKKHRGRAERMDWDIGMVSSWGLDGDFMVI